VNSKEFDKAGLPEAIRPAFGLGKPRTSKAAPRPTPATAPKAPKKRTAASKSTKG
jgi:hypothetical protein